MAKKLLYLVLVGVIVAAALAGVALLALSGWFLTGAARAGAGGVASVRAFNYLLPSAGIRGLAIARTLSRYGERLFGHRAALFALADLRPALFARLAASRSPSAQHSSENFSASSTVRCSGTRLASQRAPTS